MGSQDFNGSAGAAGSAAARPERRLVGRALSFWSGLQGARTLPSFADLRIDGTGLDADPALRPHLFVIELRSSPADSVFVHAGEILVRACGPQARNRGVKESSPAGLWNRLEYVLQACARSRKPLTLSGEFATSDGRHALYRCILMPLGEVDGPVTHLLGGFSYKPA